MESNKRTACVLLVLSSVCLAASIHWGLAMIFANGLLNINSIGEGWFESLAFLLLAYMGYKEVYKIYRGI